MNHVELIGILFVSSHISAQISEPTQQPKLSPIERRRRLLTEIMIAMVGQDEGKRKMLMNPFHPYVNETSGKCYSHVIGSFAKDCVISKSIGGWVRIQAFFAVSCKAFQIKQKQISNAINRVCTKFPFLKI